ncbi:MAG TPA: carboxypeptidase-like regulatory domain-containing protein, partial [Terriglobales bacterium]|nr:carboxypeptidase-like regulatory domain-containing protein [Terriglobales bacterium]
MKRLLMLLTLLLLAHAAALASVFGAVKVIVHDPQHRPISGARIVLKSVTSDWKSEGATREAGQFQLQTVPIGDYRLTVSAPGFSDQAIPVTVTAGNASDVHLQLAIAKVQETVNVTAESPDVNPSSSTT